MGGGGCMAAGGKNEDLGRKKGERKKEENCIKMGKNALKKWSRGVFRRGKVKEEKCIKKRRERS